MIQRHYSVTLLSDIIISARTATQGHSTCLDYIPGSNFMGIAARAYAGFDKNTAYEIFHSGEVRFGDAHLAVNGKRSLKIPCSWYHPKGTGMDTVYVHHAVSQQTRQMMRTAGDQLKQIRTGFFIQDKDDQDKNQLYKVSASHFFSIKSAYDRDRRRSKDEQMFGYDALVRGSQWIFTISGPSREILEKIHEKIIGRQYIGRSKSAQYGSVEIEEVPDYHPPQPDCAAPQKNGPLILYFESPAAFLLDCAGNFTLQPCIKDLGLETGRIDWAGSQVRHRSYAPWNGKRRGRDQDREFIDKGSVLLIRDYAPDMDMNQWAKTIENGIGLFKTEGFGAILINPYFLNVQEDEILQVSEYERSRYEPSNTSHAAAPRDQSDDHTIAWLTRKKQEMENHHEIMTHVHKFIDDYKIKFQRITASQWGAVRERAQRHTDYDSLMLQLFNPKDPKGFLYHGKSEKFWRSNRDTLENKMRELNDTLPNGPARLFLIKTATEMTKIIEKKGDTQNGNHKIRDLSLTLSGPDHI
ncbi:hypothetical protein [Desulfobacter latus]|uniref:Uncharacterized protein n=1 Tax=Desulfobacter latus TaxID=2292 RepID=A0A850T3T5_9BACT|nr:hypothetical protein [Desulfobacter latus]NWH03872.1 hypothetical protein [Desulfobacter latus]